MLRSHTLKYLVYSTVYSFAYGNFEVNFSEKFTLGEVIIDS